MGLTNAAVANFCSGILPRVSRTFALTIPVLREPLRFQVGLAYLLCRIVDTVEDHPQLTRERRDHLLGRLWPLPSRERWPEFLREWPQHPCPHHQELMRRAPELYQELLRQPTAQADAIRDCLEEMTLGMTTFPGRGDGHPAVVCPTVESLQRYCHVVAGTVGQLLSRLFAPHVANADWLDLACAERGRRFGLGLQLTNVLKDQGADRGRGICFLPPAWFEAGRVEGALTREGLECGVRLALDHLAEAGTYILSLPAQAPDLRLFCALAHHLAYATLGEVLAAEGPGPAKVSREAVGRLVNRTRHVVSDSRSLAAMQQDLASAVERRFAVA